MKPHDELEQLSAYLDGELRGAERARIDAHLPGCAECRETLAALRATVADLAALPLVEMDARSVAALDAHLAGVRSWRPRSMRRVWFSGAAAAAIVGLIATIAVVLHPTAGGHRGSETAA